MLKKGTLKKAIGLLPNNLSLKVKEVYHQKRHWAHPKLKKFGTVQDLYYWVADGSLDTFLPLQNYFSAFYPGLDTSTDGSICLFNNQGEVIGSKSFSLAHCGGAKLKVSSLLQEMGVSSQGGFGTLEVKIEIPDQVLREIRSQKCFYFWDRFYIGYMSASGQICFVHGVDKTNVYRHGEAKATPWYKRPGNHGWAPETPVDIDHYSKFSVIMINRTTTSSDVALTLADYRDNSMTWNAKIPPAGVHRFELTPEMMAGLATTELRMRVEGMASQYGRPVVFKEFPNGAISAMHC